MSDIAVQVDGVWKKFRRGEYYDSLREMIPAALRRLTGRGTRRDELAVKEFWALQDVSFQVRRGESMGIIGPNGAGKSTMFKMLSRIIRPNRGSYQVHGRLSALIEVGAGFHQDLTGRENIYLNGAILGMKRREIKAKEEQIIEFAGVQDFMDTPVKRYSSGMKARLGFAVAAHLDPEVLLVDEVLSVGDTKFRAKCVAHMKRLIRSDVTVLFVSHMLEQVRALCPTTLVLDHGRSVYHGPTEGALRKYIEVLTDDPPPGGNGRRRTNDPAEVRGLRFCDHHGRECLSWEWRTAGMIEFEVVVHRPVKDPAVLINFNTISGLYLGTVNSRVQGLDLPSEPGVYPVRLIFDPVPLGCGDYSLDYRVLAGTDERTPVWVCHQPRALSVRGGPTGMLVPFVGQWELGPRTADEYGPADQMVP